MDYFFEKEVENNARGRVEAEEKVTGKAKYSAEYDIPELAHAVMVGSTIAAGRILNIDIANAKEAPGVIDILTHNNRPTVPGIATEEAWKKSRFSLPVFHTDKIYYNEQPIAMVIAETLEDATYAASLVTADYEESEFETNFKEERDSVETIETKEEKGSRENWQNADHIIEREFKIAMEVHNPMEPHATIADWKNGELTLYDKSQNVYGVQGNIAKLFDISENNIRVISEFVGGGFGSGLLVWPNTVVAIMASQHLNRPVKVVLTRPQMFTSVGHRPESWQRFKIGADKSGKFLGCYHQAKHATSSHTGHTDNITGLTWKHYHFPNIKTEQEEIPLNIPKPTWMRGPGDASGAFAIESIVDELCEKLDMDPVEVRLMNLSETDSQGKPWSTNYLNECLKIGAEKIGWNKNRKSKPGELKEGEWNIGYGMAVGFWNAGRQDADASIEMKPNGDIIVRSAMTDIGTGTGTAMQNMAHNFLGIPKNKIAIELGDSDLPYAPSQGGSWGLSSLSGGVAAACKSLKTKLVDLAYGSKFEKGKGNLKLVKLNSDGISMEDDSLEPVSYKSIFDKNNLGVLNVKASSSPREEAKKYGFCSSAAHYVKLKVNKLTGDIKILEMVSVADGGKIINDQAAANQVIGAAIGGIGMALMEKQDIDHNHGRLIGNDLAGYHFPCNADAPIIDVSFIDKPDYNRNPAGAKGLGEVGIIGCAAAITNAIYNATGKRMRDLPVTPDKILMA
ncbi:xanthine dehydrogenase family protein molybdopterin-binding subunit [Gramella lutea]|uniref:Xanthine dehydrogenase family protein molybdopterin-binding subunit n=1 Tax=Christiangramia lutea TaxID=1607951 RepID=A0A9X1V328_9FLAO|nr:xanthine dehydrogenase family protein molybdopterin-binding subunit [Christiangramia lutea]MCH4823204.1 xanthine dehydrogenase family protein molybdopterin-binding subunit [Christiangramia lutea]